MILNHTNKEDILRTYFVESLNITKLYLGGDIEEKKLTQFVILLTGDY